MGTFDFWELAEDLFYIFGSWAMIHLGYVMGSANVKKQTFESKRAKWSYAIQQFFPCFGAMAFILGAGTLGFAYDDKFYTLQGLIQAVLVIGIPVGIGIAIGLGSSTVSPQPSSQSQTVSLPKDSEPASDPPLSHP